MQVQDSKSMSDPSSCCAGASECVEERATYRPNVDIALSGDEVLIYADLPGVEADGIEVNFERGVLELSARLPAGRPSAKALREEYAVGDFRRSFRLAEEYDGSKTRAEYRDGVLCLRVPKAEAARARRVEIRAGQG